MSLTFSTSTLANESYALKTDDLAVKRLNMQADLARKESEGHIEKAGLKKGDIAYDIACGSGVMTLLMAKIVGPTGHVYAVDISPAQLETTRKLIADSGHTNVSFVQANIEDPGFSAAINADFVYSRFLLMHLKNPGAAIKNMISILHPGGVLALQEPINSATYVAQQPTRLKGLINRLITLGRHLGVDYDIGFRLKQLAEGQGLQGVTQDEHQYELTPEIAREFLSMSYREWSFRAIKEGLQSEEELRLELADIQALNSPVFISKQIYITGKK